MKRRIAVALGAGALLATSLGAYGNPLAERPGEPHRPPMSEHALKAAGTVHGLVPGARRELAVRLANGHRFALRITMLRVAVRRPAPGCDPKNLIVKRRNRTRLLIPARGRAHVKLPVRLRVSAADACQGVRFPLRFRASAVRP